MSNCSSVDHTAEDPIHSDITRNIEEPQQKYRLGTSVISYLSMTQPYKMLSNFFHQVKDYLVNKNGVTRL